MSVFCIVLTVSNLLPLDLFALTSGPTAPEATSFEPVDTTDLVNLATGDLTYNIPLIEIPGPAGGYPLSLSYHAGIQPNEDASWVGLGWNLNPGAINRSVSGFADDITGVTGTSRTFWEGGQYKSLEIGVTMGIAGSPSMTAGLSFSEDTYQGINRSFYVNVGGVGFRSTETSRPGASSHNATIGIATRNGMQLSLSSNGAADFSTSNNPFGTLSGLTNMDISLKTVKNLVTSRVGIVSNVNNSKENNISTKGHDFSVKIPTPWGLSVKLAKSYQRYWIDESETSSMLGALYLPKTQLTNEEINSKAFDVYDLPVIDIDTQVSNYHLGIDKSDSKLGGSFLDYDHYNVVAQGLGGTMRPYHYKSKLYRQTKYAEDGTTILTKTFPLGNNLDAHFRFEGDFSNRLLYSNTSFQNPLGYQFGATATTTGEFGNDGYDPNSNFLQGSRYIQSFTNSSITSGSARAQGFLNCNALGFNRADYGGSQIGGFRITNENGVTYHFSLPVHSYDEYSYSGRTDEAGKVYFNHHQNSSKYAYTWLLTAVTGPDYVDRNNTGIADIGDWGYWVSFEYGKWTNDYGWRNPSEGFSKDLDQTFDFFSKGKKEVYYLNFAKTASHTAVFVKEIRPDAKGVTSLYKEAVKAGGSIDYLDTGGFDVLDGVVPGTKIYPRSSLRLDRVLLFNNADFDWDLPGRSSTYNHMNGTEQVHFGLNVVDIHDVEDIVDEVNSKSIRGAIFESDYSLCERTPNSFYSDYDVSGTTTPRDDVNDPRRGKLTLRSVQTTGKMGVAVIPPQNFSYDYQGGSYSQSEITSMFSVNDDSFARISVSNDQSFYNEIRIHEILRFEQGGVSHEGTVSSKADQLITVRLISSPRPYLGNIQNLHKTKNPNYQKEFYDSWGMYKSDYYDGSSIRGVGSTPENIARMTTSVSSKSVDVWSLREISSPLGAVIGIEYESDTYQNAIKSLTDLQIKSIEISSASPPRLKVSFFNDITSIPLQIGNSYQIDAFFRRKGVPNTLIKLQCSGNSLNETFLWSALHSGLPTATVTSVGSDYIIVDDPYLFIEVNKPDDQIIFINPSTLEAAEGGGGSIEYRFDGSELISAHLALPTAVMSNYGGGVRVKSVKLTSDNKTKETVYEYSNGVTPYEPLGMQLPVDVIDQNYATCLKDKEKEKIKSFNEKSYYKNILGEFLELFSTSRELPGPGVIYGTVAVTERLYSDQNLSDPTEIPGKILYEFEVFNSEMVNLNRQIDPQYMNRGYTGIEDFSSRMGSLKRIANLDENDNVISEVRNIYLHDGKTLEQFKNELGTVFKSQGTITETFADAREVKNTTDAGYTPFAVVSQKITYPNIQISTERRDYKLGTIEITKTGGFDFYSGQVVKSIHYDGFGNSYLTETIPAYREYAEMGFGNSGGKNMLTQDAGTTVFKVDPQNIANKLGLVSASIQTWSKDLPVALFANQSTQKIYRKHATYSWKGDNMTLQPDGLYPASSFIEFDGWLDGVTSSNQWQKNGEIMLYDPNSHALEAKDINGNSAATKMSSDYVRVFASASNSTYNEIAYSGAEDVPEVLNGFYGGDVRIKDGIEVFSLGSTDRVTTHTGNKALRLTASGAKAFEYGLGAKANRVYRASVWVNHQNGVIRHSINGVVQPIGVGPNNGAVAPVSGKKAGEWFQINLDIPIGTSPVSLVIWCETTASACNFDDFRVHPVDGPMTSYVYNQWGELSHILDNQNLYTEFQYDEAGRLVRTFKETIHQNGFWGPDYGDQGIVKVSEIAYNYGKSNEYQINITSSSTGNTGSLSPTTATTSQGGQATVTVNNVCNPGQLLGIRIDNSSTYLAQGSTTLFDGTQVTYNGTNIVFSNTQSPHTVKADFSSGVTGGNVFCHKDMSNCPTGSYDYFIRDVCGVEHPGHAENASQVPAELQHLIPNDCCDNAPAGCDCSISQQ